MFDLVKRLVDWIEIPSVTGDEADYGDAVIRLLQELGFDVERQQVQDGRFNVIARAGDPDVVFCTHLDTVPPFFGSKQDAEFIYGRGACDAKGQAIAMLAAGAQLLSEGVDHIGFLFTVGEETDSIGASFADEHLAASSPPRYVIVGEPTDNSFISAHKGIFKARLVAHGVAGHSSQKVGPSAIHELVSCSHALLAADWGQHPILGEGSLNIGLFDGGIASNVVADRAEAEILIRSVEEPDVVQARIESCLGLHVDLVDTFKNFGPVGFHVPAGEAAEPVAFGTDAPHMRKWGKPLLFGAGSILDAHTEHEKLNKQDLAKCVQRHVRTVHELLAVRSPK